VSSSPIAGQFYFAGLPAAGGMAPPAGSTLVADAERTWGRVQNTTSLAVVDDFIQHYGTVPVYGPLARAKRDELAKLAVPPQPPPPPSGAAPLTAQQERGLTPKDTFRECENCPEMVVVPAGSFTMGSPAGENRWSNEGPQHVVAISRPFAVGKLHVTRDQFAVFARETRLAAHSGCDWRNPGFSQDGSHPVVCVSWNDAKAYADWLAKKTGKPYRLLSEAEWEYAARAGTSTPFWWGSSITARANYEGKYVFVGDGGKFEYRKGTVPAGSFDANPWGLYDVHGNAWQWTEDCWHENYNDAPADGSAWTTGNCNNGRVVRGGSWGNDPSYLRAAQRSWFTDETYFVGFRLARTLTP
jgi:formylglycine-generating enzyme required for sulfatase activity